MQSQGALILCALQLAPSMQRQGPYVLCALQPVPSVQSQGPHRSGSNRKAKRARTSQHEDAVILSVQQLAASEPTQPQRLKAPDTAVSPPSDRFGSLGKPGMQQNQAKQQLARKQVRNAALQSVGVQVTNLTDEGCVAEIEVLQIDGFMNYLVLSQRSKSQPAHALSIYDDPGLSGVSRVVKGAVEFGSLCSRIGLAVLAIDVQLLNGHLYFHAICYFERLNC